MSKETKFTKGDWSIYNYEEAVNCDDELASINVGPIEICEGIENNHDAHLIKTAPKLYYAIDTVLSVLNGDTEFSPDEIDLFELKNLLAEARGE